MNEIGGEREGGGDRLRRERSILGILLIGTRCMHVTV